MGYESNGYESIGYEFVGYKCIGCEFVGCEFVGCKFIGCELTVMVTSNARTSDLTPANHVDDMEPQPNMVRKLLNKASFCCVLSNSKLVKMYVIHFNHLAGWVINR